MGQERRIVVSAGMDGSGNRSFQMPSIVRLSEVLAGLSFALDLTEGQRPGHAVRSCAIGMRVADEIDLPQELRSALFYALLMKDLGCSSNAARFSALFAADDHGIKTRLKVTNWSDGLEAFRFVAGSVAPGHFWLRRVWQMLAVLSRGPEGARAVVRTRCERGADIAGTLGVTPHTIEAIRALDEHWDGHGQPYSLKGEQIPLLGRILGFAQTAEVYWSTYGFDAAYAMASARRGTWFDPDLVRAFESMKHDVEFWDRLRKGHTLAQVAAYEPPDEAIVATDARLDLVADAFARVIDAKSPWTYSHSTGVARLATEMADRLGFSGPHLRELRRAALLHDLGKLGVSNLILDKPGRLTASEMASMQRHPEFTHAILSRVGCFEHLASDAAAHHERLDGRGYHRSLSAGELSMTTRVLGVADICDALLTSRPYRAGLPAERVLEIMKRDVGAALDPDCYSALRTVLMNQGVVQPKATLPAVQLVPALAEDYVQAA